MKLMASIEQIRASDGTSNAAVATIQSTRAPLATTIIVDTVDGINPGGFMGSMGTPHTFVDPITSETITVISEDTCVDFSGHVDGSNLEIDDIAPGYTDAGSQANDIVIIRPTTQYADNVADVLDVVHEDDGTLKDTTVAFDNLSANLQKGWLDSSNTWVYVSATSFKITGSDVTAKFPVGTKIRLTQTTTKYFYVTSATFSTDTTVNITGGTDYTLANAVITLPSYSYASTPQDFPSVFAWTPTFVNWTIGTGGSAGTTGKFRMIGKRVFYSIHTVLGSSGQSVGSGVTFSLPVNASTNVTSATNMPIGTGIGKAASTDDFIFYIHYSATQVGAVKPIISSRGAGAAYVAMGAISSAGPATWVAGNYLDLAGNYEAA